MSDQTADRTIAVPRSTLFDIGRNITNGRLSAAAQTIIDILKADADSYEPIP